MNIVELSEQFPEAFKDLPEQYKSANDVSFYVDKNDYLTLKIGKFILGTFYGCEWHIGKDSKLIFEEIGAGGYGRPIQIFQEEVKCDVCKWTKKCLGFDSSDSEYGAINICKTCFDTLFSS